MTPLENYMKLLYLITNALTCIGQNIPGEGKEWVNDVIQAIESDAFLTKDEKDFLLKNMDECKKELYSHDFRYAATSIGRVCSSVLEKATSLAKTTGAAVPS